MQPTPMRPWPRSSRSGASVPDSEVRKPLRRPPVRMINCGHSIAGEESRLQKASFGLVACALLYALPPPIGTAAAQAITVGATSSTSDAPIYIADKKGYFRDEGLDVKVTNFRSAADMVAPLGAGQIEAGAGSASAGLYNAVARGIKIKIAADKASSPPGYGGTKILVRKDYVESGRYRSLQDLKGMKFAMNA